jgi:hypothetical protein
MYDGGVFLTDYRINADEGAASYWFLDPGMSGFNVGVHKELVRGYIRGDDREIQYKFSVT